MVTYRKPDTRALSPSQRMRSNGTDRVKSSTPPSQLHLIIPTAQAYEGIMGEICESCGDFYELLTDVRVLNALTNLLE